MRFRIPVSRMRKGMAFGAFIISLIAFGGLTAFAAISLSTTTAAILNFDSIGTSATSRSADGFSRGCYRDVYCARCPQARDVCRRCFSGGSGWRRQPLDERRERRLQFWRWYDNYRFQSSHRLSGVGQRDGRRQSLCALYERKRGAFPDCRSLTASRNTATG